MYLNIVDLNNITSSNSVYENFSINDVLSNPLFDQLLDSIERDIFYSAVDKNDESKYIIYNKFENVIIDYIKILV